MSNSKELRNITYLCKKGKGNYKYNILHKEKFPVNHPLLLGLWSLMLRLAINVRAELW